MNKVEVAQALKDGGFFSRFMGKGQRKALTVALQSEEGCWFAKTLSDLHDRIVAMPVPYATDGQGKDAIAYLHYFGGNVDMWITEKDATDGRITDQHQAFGMVCLTGNIEDAELGYISIAEAIGVGIELDLHWTPKSLRECE